MTRRRRRPGRRGRLRRHRSTLLIAGGLVARRAGRGRPGRRRPHHGATSTRTTPGPDGARALARVLERRGGRGDGRPDRRRPRGPRAGRAHDRARHQPSRTSAPAPASGCAQRPRTPWWCSPSPDPGDRRARRRAGHSRVAVRRRAAACTAPTWRPVRRSRDLASTRASAYPAAGRLLPRRRRRPAGRARGRARAARRRRTSCATTRCCAPTTPRSRCGCSASATAWSGTSPTTPTSAPPTAVSLAHAAAGLAAARRCGWARSPLLALLLWRGRRLGAAGHRAAAGRGQGDRDHPQPRAALPQGRRPRPRRRGAAGGRGARAVGRAPAAPRRRGPERPRRATSPGTSAGRSTEIDALLAPGAPVAGHRPRPDRAGRPRWPSSTERYAAHDRPEHRRPTPGPTTTRSASGSPPSAPRSRRPSSARTPPCPGCWSRCCAAGTC